jgi:transcription initiation factor TFIIIB Brf1 subunit/transcription initiation factor TFIIB
MSAPRPSPSPSPAASRRARGPKPQSRPPRLFTTNSTSSSRPRLDSLTPGPTAPPRPTTYTCPNPTCTAPNNVAQEDDGSYVCRHCGTIASEHSHIVSEIQFGETASGAAAVQGQFIGADQTHGRPGPGGRRAGYGAGGGDGMNSRQLTELNARREMGALVANLRNKSVSIAQSFIEPAIGLFRLALNHNFVQGRSISTVAAVALYLQCRRNKGTNEVMLIDIAECINVNVFVLGKMYTKLIQKLYGTTNQKAAFTDKIDTINPENLIRRFANGLDFPGRDVRNQVVADAIRLVQRMDRDWMATGRRPAGICGAALILAARMNNFRRTVREVVLVVKVTEITINKRLEEFSYTDSSNLTVEQFRGITLERDCDPPAFYKARQEKKPKRGRKRKGAPETAAEIEGDEQNDDEEAVEAASQPAQKRPRIDRDGFAIPEIPIDPALRRFAPRNSNSAGATEEELPEPSLPLGNSNAEKPIDEALTLAVNSAISEMETEHQASVASRESSTLQASGSIPRESENFPSEAAPGDQPKRRQGRPKGAKNWQPPPASAAELALEAAIEGEVREVLESGVMQAIDPKLKSVAPASPPTKLASRLDHSAAVHSSPTASLPLTGPVSERDTSPSVTPPSTNAPATLLPSGPSRLSTTAPSTVTTNSAATNNPSTVEDTTLLDLDDDPEVSSCILSQEEIDIKERIWVTENADWLRKDHVKRIKAELQAAADREAGIDPNEAGQGKGKGRGKKRKRGRLGDVSYLDKGDKDKGGRPSGEDGEEGGAARSAREAMLKMMAHRGYSRRVNYDVFTSLFPEDEEAARQRSSRSSTSTTAGERRRSSVTRATTSGSPSPARTPTVEKDAAAGPGKSTTAASPSSPTSSATASVTSAAGSAGSPMAKPGPRPQARKGVSTATVPITEASKLPPTPSEPSRSTKPLSGTSVSSSATTGGHGQTSGGQKGVEEQENRRQARAVADAVLAKEWDEEVEEGEEVLNEAEREEKSWMARVAPKDGPVLASASAGEGRTRATAVRLATPSSRAQSLVRELSPLASAQSQAQVQVSGQISSTGHPVVSTHVGEDDIFGSTDSSPLTSLRSSVIIGGGGGDDDDDDDDGEGAPEDYVDDDDDDVEAAFAGRFKRRESFDDDDDDDEDMEDV